VSDAIYHERIEWHPSDKGGGPLGRHILHDPRSRQFEAEQASVLKSVTHGQVGAALPLDQGNRGSCTAQALCGARNMHPDHRTGDKVLQEADANKLYDEEVRAEGYDPAVDDPGGTGVMVCKSAVKDGLISKYTHTFSLDAALKALVLSAVMIGSNWYDSMDTPNAQGLVEITPDASVRGGHEYVLRGLHLPSKTVWAWQSWGPGFGLGGRFCMTFDTLGRLLHERGDATVPVR
jgi:hypothetical protein